MKDFYFETPKRIRLICTAKTRYEALVIIREEWHIGETLKYLYCREAV